MRKFILGLIIGVSITYSFNSLAAGDDLELNKSGRLRNYEVLGINGKRVCEDPFLYHDSKVVMCE